MNQTLPAAACGTVGMPWDLSNTAIRSYTKWEWMVLVSACVFQNKGKGGGTPYTGANDAKSVYFLGFSEVMACCIFTLVRWGWPKPQSPKAQRQNEVPSVEVKLVNMLQWRQAVIKVSGRRQGSPSLSLSPHRFSSSPSQIAVLIETDH